ncbi:hypothetical protein B296_00036054, partial [Ensete ventricosum]
LLFFLFVRLGSSVACGDGGSEAGGDHASAHGSAPRFGVLHRFQSILGCVESLSPTFLILLIFSFPGFNGCVLVRVRSGLCLTFWRIGEAIALGFQHYILALGTAVMIPTLLVPLMGGTDVSLHITTSHSVSNLSRLCIRLEDVWRLAFQCLSYSLHHPRY